MILLSERKMVTIDISVKPNFCNEDQFLVLGLLLSFRLTVMYKVWLKPGSHFEPMVKWDFYFQERFLGYVESEISWKR